MTRPSDPSMTSRPERKALPHDAPWWVEDGATFFVTLCVRARGQHVLCLPEVATALVESVRFRVERSQWEVPLLLLMPDHLHMLARFNPDSGMRQPVSDWKRYTTRHVGIAWQRDFFDHRIRNEDELMRKAAYIRLNPVRAGLVEHPEAWPYTWEPVGRAR